MQTASGSQDLAGSGDFVTRFERAWASRDAARLKELMHPDVELVQPVLPTMVGRERGTRGMASFIDAMPDLEIEIVDSCANGSRVFIEFRFSGTVGKRRVAFGLVDRIELVDGLVKKRVSYFDPIPFLRAVAAQPRLWGRLLRAMRS